MVQRYNPDYVMHAARFEPFARENEHGEYVKFSDYEILKAELDALADRVKSLAVENAALKDAITTHSQSTHFCELCGKDDPCSTDDVCYALNETPATSAALAAIRNEATARAFKHLCDCQLISSTVAELKTDELREAK
ncbi:hypothetical protein [Serratia marcescens]|uniref:hypothetical protein n=1 Tax=Serratia marcescens TaxID=615 RepID=UPI003F7FEB89